MEEGNGEILFEGGRTRLIAKEEEYLMTIELPAPLEERRVFSNERLEELRSHLSRLDELAKLPGLAVYATGSYGRQEASEHSDIDLFFIHKGTVGGEARVSRLDELRLFARIIEIGEKMQFPTFSNDGEYLKILYVDDILAHLGGQKDDHDNYFTARLLLLLESTSLANHELYHSILGETVGAYFRDYPDHAESFRPVFLINDILRFWKTLCLNYEHKRNKPDNDDATKTKQQIKNFKLKFSRLMTCFGTVAAVCAKSPPIEKDQILAMTGQVPLDRFIGATIGLKELDDLRQAIIEDYIWFMEKTGLPADALKAEFEKSGSKTEFFARAESFGARVYEVVSFLARRNAYERYLVV